MSQSEPSQHSVLSPNDAFAKVFGKEHPSRVRGLGMGVFPTSVFRTNSQRGYSTSSSSVNIASQQEVQNLKSELAHTQGELAETKGQLDETKGELVETKEQVRAIFEYIKVIGGSIPPHIFNQQPANQQVHVQLNVLVWF